MCLWNGGKKWGKENSENKLKLIENNKIREFGDSRVVDYGLWWVLGVIEIFCFLLVDKCLEWLFDIVENGNERSVLDGWDGMGRVDVNVKLKDGSKL